MECPQCQVEATKVGTYWICPTHGQLPEPKPHVPMRIFLSYGHDNNEELVRLIKAELEKRGHDVWLDRSEIKFGDEWRRTITEGITGSHKFLSFLSKHSTRDPGVCRDEIAIAIGVKGGNIQTILVESEQEVQPPVNIGHIQWLDMHDWKEQRAAGEAAWEPWYQAKLAEIVRVVESDESRRFAGEIETLNGHLKPIKSEARICQLLCKGFYGRQWLFEAVEKWRQDTKLDSRLFWIMGAPGVGKSAFAAQLTHTRGDTVIAAQFCEWDKPDHRNAPRVVRSLAFQLATRLPDYRKLLLTLPEISELDRKDGAELFAYLLANPLRSVINGGRERHLIVIDALDEAGEGGRNPLVEMLAHNAQHLPDWLGLVVTSRPEFDVKTSLQALNPFPLDTKTESNCADIRDYLRREMALQLQKRPDADHLVEHILEKSEGVFLYVERFCDDLRHDHISLDRPEQFPQGLGGIFCQYFQRQFPDLGKFRKDVRPALRALLAAVEPLPVEILQRLFNWQDEELLDFTRPLASLFPITTAGGHEVIKPYHKSLADWLADEAKGGPYFVSVQEGHRMLAEFGWRQYEQGVGSMSPYSLRHLPRHLVEACLWDAAERVFSDPKFIDENVKRSKLILNVTELDFQICAAVMACPHTGDLPYSLFLNSALIRGLPRWGCLFETLASSGLDVLPNRNQMTMLVRSGRVTSHELAEAFPKSFYFFFVPATIDIVREDAGSEFMKNIVHVLGNMREYDELSLLKRLAQEALADLLHCFRDMGYQCSWRIDACYGIIAAICEELDRSRRATDTEDTEACLPRTPTEKSFRM